MGLFSVKKRVNYNELFKEKYKYVNNLMRDVYNERDYIIKEALWQNIVDSYQELVELIDKGADFDKGHFISLKEHACEELEKVKSLNNE